MARIHKTGLDYFPLDVTFLSNRKVRRLVRKHGPMAIAVMIAIYSATYNEKGYYLEWNEDVCFDLSELANTEFEKVQAFIVDAMHMELFDAGMFKEHGIITSKTIQKQYITCTQKRKTVEIKENYRLYIPETTSPQPSPKEREKEAYHNDGSNSIDAPQTALWGTETPEKGTEITQSKAKEIESKEKQSTPTTSPLRGTPPRAGGELEEEGEKVLFSGRWVPQYCLNTRTHNHDGLLNRLNQIHVTDMKDVNKILELSDYGKLGHPLWGIISYSNWPKGGGIKYPGKYILSQLKQL